MIQILMNFLEGFNNIENQSSPSSQSVSPSNSRRLYSDAAKGNQEVKLVLLKIKLIK